MIIYPSIFSILKMIVFIQSAELIVEFVKAHYPPSEIKRIEKEIAWVKFMLLFLFFMLTYWNSVMLEKSFLFFLDQRVSLQIPSVFFQYKFVLKTVHFFFQQKICFSSTNLYCFFLFCFGKAQDQRNMVFFTLYQFFFIFDFPLKVYCFFIESGTKLYLFFC